MADAMGGKDLLLVCYLRLLQPKKSPAGAGLVKGPRLDIGRVAGAVTPRAARPLRALARPAGRPGARVECPVRRGVNP